MKVKSAWLGLVLWLPVSALAGASIWIPFETQGGRIAIEVEMDGRPALAMLDTGSTINAISKNFLKSHSRKFKQGGVIRVQGVTGIEKTSMVDGVPVRLFGVDLRLDQLVPARLGKTDLLLGVGFFNRFVVQIDYPNRRMRLVDHDSIDLKKSGNVRLKRDRNRLPMVEVTMNGDYKTWLTLDTGNSGGIFLERRIAERRGWLDSYTSVAKMAQGLTGHIVETETFNLPTMEFGPVQLENVMVTVPVNPGEMFISDSEGVQGQGGHSKIAKKGAKGLLGYDVLKHFLVTLDYKRSGMHIAVVEANHDESQANISD